MATIAKLRESVTAGEPVVRRNLTIIPLLARQKPPQAEYITFGAGRRLGVVSVTEISEGGSVPQLVVVNDGDVPVLLLDGEELIGARQNRIVNLTILVPAKTRLTIPVSCVEQGRWGWKSRHFAESDQVMHATARARKARDVNQSLKERGTRYTDQSAVWKDVAELSGAMQTTSSTGAMSDVYDQNRGSIDAVTQGVAPVENQVGAVFAIDGEVAGIEIFDAAETLSFYFPKILKSYAVDALSRRPNGASQSVPADAGNRLLESLEATPPDRFAAIGLGEDMRWNTESSAAGALEWADRVIHLAAFGAAAGANGDL